MEEDLNLEEPAKEESSAYQEQEIEEENSSLPDI